MNQERPLRQVLCLNGEWEFRQVGIENWKPAAVPGSVFTDLLALGDILDPFVGEHEKDVQWVAQQDWEYRITFPVSRSILKADQVNLVLEGIDTLADIWLNGELLLKTANQFRIYRQPVKESLRLGENSITIRIHSPLKYTTEQQKRRPLIGAFGALPGAPYLRKAPYHFGWDWGPQLPDMGIWKDIYPETAATARLDDVHIRQRHTAGPVEVSAAVTIKRLKSEDLTLELRIVSPDGEEYLSRSAVMGENADASVSIGNPQLWWPVDYGGQPLYQVFVRLLSGTELLDERQYSLGLRTVELLQAEDEWGLSFTFVVNGVPVFCKGANWIPADSFITRVDRSRLEHLIASAASVHQNMLRVWGGGFYESDDFYDLCDRYGILIWQDFVFACGVYPFIDPEFLENVHHEVIDNARRLRHHASLALWCGNNEMELGWAQWGWSIPQNADLKHTYNQFFHSTLPAWMSVDPDTAYWPSSPSSGRVFNDPNGDRAGDAHHWNVWHGMEPLRSFRGKMSRFISEFGMQSIPHPATLAEFADPSEWRLASKVMLRHQRAPKGNGKIGTYLVENFRIPKSFEDLVYVSQVLQAETLRIGVEHWRRSWPRSAGALYWQLNDCWPVLSWSSIDYFGRWKAAHYAARRFFNPLLLSIEDDGPRMKAFVCSDLTANWAGVFTWSLEYLDGRVIDAGMEEVSVAPQSVTGIKTFDFSLQVSKEDRRRTVLVTELKQAGKQAALQVVPIVPDRELELEDPNLKITVHSALEEIQIRLTSSSLARFVELSIDGADVTFSDNYFEIPAGRSALVTCKLPSGWTVERASAALQTRTLYHSYTN